MLPAAALMGFSIWNLKHIQRSGQVEAAFQRDFSHVLQIAEKKSWHKAYDMVIPIRGQFPNADQSRAEIEAKLDRILTQHPEFSYALFYDKKSNLFVSRTQPGRNSDPNFCERSQEAIKMAASWIPLEAPHTAAKVRLAMAEGRRAGVVRWRLDAH